MRIFAIGALLITLPAFVAAIYALIFGPRWLFYAAIASTGFNLIPFVAAHFLTRGDEDSHDLSH
ncbi:MAG TPA: hypothetical protein VF263_06190 [Longimicrobiaceae bacterium]